MAIIGIISAIAVPQFTAQRDKAAKVASDTSAGNIAKAFKNCLALSGFSSCNTMAAIKISCPAGSSCDSGGTGGTFCAHIHKGTAGDDDFKVCVSINNAGEEIRSYGGALLSSVTSSEVCHTEKTTGGTCAATSPTPEPGLKTCTTGTLLADCGSDTPADAPNNQCGTKKTCAQVTTVGNCDKTTGLCS